MKNVTHTPGPWLAHEDHRQGSDQHSWRITDVCESEVVCAKTAWSDTASKTDRERIRANMAMIAAAPDLFAALVRICEHATECEMHGEPSTVDGIEWDDIIHARQTIAAACLVKTGV